ncbi:MAG TPA: MBL fold metallo-hydrolase [Clostridiales bacterium]|nr:MBL fold metallo-hydrolase [Clostridiales bacterium]
MSGKKGKKINIVLIILVSVVLAVSLIVQLAPIIGVELPSYSEIFSMLGVGPKPDRSRNYVKFLDVGNADCILIHSKGKFALIDSGDNSDEGWGLVSKLRSIGVTEIETAFVTHPHADHIGGMDLVLENFNVKQLVMPDYKPTQTADVNTYNQLVEAVKKKSVKVYRPAIGNQYKIGDFKLTTVAYLPGQLEENDRSVVLKAECGGVSFLFMGDAGENTENEIIRSRQNVKSHVLKLGHHGSKTATTETFLDYVNPQCAIVTAAFDNSYGHPSDEVVERLNGKNIKLYQTGVNGTISCYVEKTGLVIETER